MVVEAARQDARTVGDVAHGGGAQSTFGEHGRGEIQQLVAPHSPDRSLGPPDKRINQALARPGSTITEILAETQVYTSASS